MTPAVGASRSPSRPGTDDDTGPGVAGAEVTFAVDGHEHGPVTTDDEGTASTTVEVADHGGSVDVLAEFPGDDRNAPSSDQATVTWGNRYDGRGGGSGPPGSDPSSTATLAGLASGPPGAAGLLLLLALTGSVLARRRLRTITPPDSSTTPGG